ncbi:MAG: ABC transporter permease [marine benthic group bacterium]|nr:ABC transporter permease [Gemmatimonadota bacterium]MCL7961495.1 ABC transporter permease [Candidatus Carthagonibacter metallireducens]MCL7964517.1 ABC transporter permease [Gemmatimonadota bacterium]MCL7967141.1 ABC transporter permease [Gemmatimonadota bacterium]MCL7970086.1 ABC transporter permease [Gemmatimonadota bacterium]
MRSLREATRGMRRAPLLSGLSIAAIGLSLFIIGLFALTAHNIDEALTDVESRVEVVAYLEEGTPEAIVSVARSEIGGFPEIEEVRFVSKVEALYDASRELTEFSDVFSDLEVNPLPASFELRLREGSRTPEDVERVAERLRGYEFVEEVRYGREWVDKVYALRRIAGGAALALGSAFALGSILLIGTAVRMAVLARSREISIMQTVGATDSFIRRPFLVEGLLTGIAGGILALGLTWLAWWTVNRSLLELQWLPDLWVALGIVLAAALGVLAAGRGVRKEISRIEAL